MQKDCVMSHALPISSILIYLSNKDQVKHQGRSFLQQLKAINPGLFYVLTVHTHKQ